MSHEKKTSAIDTLVANLKESMRKYESELAIETAETVVREATEDGLSIEDIEVALLERGLLVKS
jgi:hypothetical protein